LKINQAFDFWAFGEGLRSIHSSTKRNRARILSACGQNFKSDRLLASPIGEASSPSRAHTKRRHDTKNERAMVGARMANLKQGQMGNGRVESSMETSTPAIAIDRAAELSGTKKPAPS
jgi:hypothetical protein